MYDKKKLEDVIKRYKKVAKAGEKIKKKIAEEKGS